MDVQKLNDKQVKLFFSHDIFQILSQPIRIEILKFLALNGPNDINTVAGNFNKHRSVISKHLKQMYNAGILIKAKQSKNTIYQIDGEAFLQKMELVVSDLKQLLACCHKDCYQELNNKDEF
ncbi:MAG: ArsR family transcriptional regulator [Clostridia bacterium]|nr:ArsR family transcriptional regulator [Clostridia bacterium]